ncbi:MAG TPA: T9SS type A sorting domain-containing protein [Flavobacterium sp.]|nr:T9SS type A sorting domain-containing protein [Flavobacterium sp.]HPJ10526.1 T9SS type A sorting domain-containing protein [Flavobacterium sp.]
MKTNYNVLKTIAIALLFSTASWSQATIAQWNFNGPSNTEVPGGVSSPTPSVGAGSAELVALTLAATFASGNTTVGTLETETTSPPNYGWNSTGYPATATAPDKTSGVQYNVSTVGQAGIIFRFEQRLSNTSNNTYVVQYTADRTAGSPVWVDGPVFTFTPAATGTGDTWYNARIANFETVTALDNNPNVAFRILSTYDPVAGTYLAARSTSTYAGGTVRFDMVTITSNVTLATSQFASKKAFAVYPNPTSKGIVTLSQPQDINVYDLTGKLIYTAKNAETINTQSFNAGVYMVQTATGETTKLVVK